MARPPRLPSITYKGPGVYFVTTCTNQRSRHFADPILVDETLGNFLQSASKAGVEVIAYCFMPDHLHLLVEAAAAGDLIRFMRRAKQTSGYAFTQKTRSHLWQSGYHERVLRSDEDALTVAAYIVANPIRAGLATKAEDWPYWGSAKYSRDEILEAIAMGQDRKWRG